MIYRLPSGLNLIEAIAGTFLPFVLIYAAIPEARRDVNSFAISLLQSWRIRNAEIDPNSKCPSCGHHDGELKCTQVGDGSDWMVQHTCHVCHAAWFEPTIVKPEKWIPAELLGKTMKPRPS